MLRDYILTSIVIVLLPVCLFRPWIGVLAWYWIGIMNPHRLTFGFAYDMPFALWIGALTLLGLVFAQDRKPIAWSREMVLLMLLLAYFTFTTLFAWVPDVAWSQLEKVAKIILMTLVTTMFIYGKNRIRALLITVALSVGFFGIKGAVWVFLTGGSEHIQGPDNSFLEGNTFIGLAFTMVVPLLISLGRAESKRWLRRFFFIAAGLTIISTIFTYSRGAYLGLVVIIPLLFFRSKQKVIAASILIPAILLAPVVLPDKIFQRADQIGNYEEETSANQRLQSWTVAWNLAKDHPLTGGGFSFEYGDADRWLTYASDKYLRFLSVPSAAHSIYFQMLGQHGFGGFFLFVGMLLATLLSLQRLKRTAEAIPGLQWIAIYSSGLQIGMIGYMVSGGFLSAAYFDLAYVYIAMSGIFAREIKANDAQQTQLAEVHPDVSGLPRKRDALAP